MYKTFKVESGRFEVYEEDAQGNTVQVLSPDYATEAEATAKAAEMNEVPAKEKTAEEIQAEADAKAAADAAAADDSKSGDERAEEGAEGDESSPKAGDVCQTADGKAGTLQLEGDALVCVANPE